MVPVNPGLFLKITGTGITITKKGPEFAGTGIPVGHYKVWFYQKSDFTIQRAGILL